MQRERAHAESPYTNLGFRSILMAGTVGGWLCGIWIGLLTLRLNPTFDGAAVDSIMLCLVIGLLYALGGTAWGLAWATVDLLVRSLPGTNLRRVASPAAMSPAAMSPAAMGAAFGLPAAGALLLPDTGLHRTALTNFLALERSMQLVGIVALVAFLCGLGWAVDRVTPLRSKRWRWIAMAVSALLLALSPFMASSRSTTQNAAPEVARLEAGRPPLILLCIDGADPDDVVLPLIESGDLPTFARLKREGAFGELKTISPTLSPAVWTTMATGKAPQEHGIYHFIIFDLPGVKRPVSVFPLHTGLNFKVFPKLEKLPGVPTLQAPYTSELRRQPALWNMLGDQAPAGMFRWRVTWPAEEINGFAVASDVSLLDQMPGYSESATDLKERRLHPIDIYRGTARVERLPPDPVEVARYLGPDVRPEELDLESKDLRQVVRGINRVLPIRLTEAIKKYRPAMTVAGFHSVDGFSHLYWRQRLRGGRFESAIEERYRFVDEQLGETLHALTQSLGVFNLMVVSDHGFDFQRGHHTHAPAGIFFGWGPAFDPGTEARELDVYDITPMALDLAGLPLALDMPAVSGDRSEPTYRQVLSPAFRSAHQLRFIDTYGTRSIEDAVSETPFEEETLKKLRSLGYIE